MAGKRKNAGNFAVMAWCGVFLPTRGFSGLRRRDVDISSAKHYNRQDQSRSGDACRLACIAPLVYGMGPPGVELGESCQWIPLLSLDCGYPLTWKQQNVTTIRLKLKLPKEANLPVFAKTGVASPRTATAMASQFEKSSPSGKFLHSGDDSERPAKSVHTC